MGSNRNKEAEGWYRCQPCGKQGYTSRRTARDWRARHHRGDHHVTVYRCPVNGDYWHLGHNTTTPFLQYEAEKITAQLDARLIEGETA